MGFDGINERSQLRAHKIFGAILNLLRQKLEDTEQAVFLICCEAVAKIVCTQEGRSLQDCIHELASSGVRTRATMELKKKNLSKRMDNYFDLITCTQCSV